MAKQSTRETLGLTKEHIEKGLALLTKDRTVRRRGKTVTVPAYAVVENDRVYARDLYMAERDIARHLRRLLSASTDVLDVPSDVFGNKTPDADQAAAVVRASSANVVVVTGGPGVGKTFTVAAMIKMYEANGLTTLNCAPTGKAAVRITQQTGKAASTVHGLIGLRPGCAPKHDETNPVGGANVFILDESSMVDVELASALLSAIPTGARVLIVGDVDQLPSIGAGRVLFDLIVSQVLPVVRLNKIHRQASESRIPYVARDINNGECPDLHLKGTDVTHWEVSDQTQAANWVIRAVVDAIPTAKGFGLDDIQVLASQYGDRGAETSPVGVVALNRGLQHAINPAVDGINGDVFINRSYTTRAKDKVIQIRNNYELGIMNGEIGRVVAADPHGLPLPADLDSVMWSGKMPEMSTDGDADDDASFDDARDDAEDPTSGYKGLKVTRQDGETVVTWKDARTLIVDFGAVNGKPRLIAYTKSEARELELGYCITVHKSQGSQFKAAVIVAPSAHGFMLTRALLYTAITRAEQYCLIVGEAAQVAKSARNTRGTDRRTALQARLAAAPVASASSLFSLPSE